MSAFPWLVGGAVVGLGYLWYRNQQAKASTAPPDQCTTLCTAALGQNAADPTEMGACKAACAAGLSTLGDIAKWVQDQPWGDLGATVAKQNAQEAAYAAHNQALNGPIAVGINGPGLFDGHTHGLAGDALMYGNGCWPFKGSWGWNACAPGTQDMFDQVQNLANGAERSTQPVSAYVAKAAPGPIVSKLVYVASALGGGSLDPSNPDLATTGPEVTDADGHADAYSHCVNVGGVNCAQKYPPDPTKQGFWTWFVGGARVTCPAGQTPSYADANGSPTSTPTNNFYGYPCIGGSTPAQPILGILGRGATGRAAPSSTTNQPGNLAVTRGFVASPLP